MISTALLLALISADPVEPVAIPASFVRVIDGDTFVMRAHLPFDVHIDITIRLRGVNCPEVKGLSARAGKAATEYARTWVATYPDVIIHDVGSRSLGRMVSTICPPGGGQCLTEALIASGHGVAYDHKAERAKKRRARRRNKR